MTQKEFNGINYVGAGSVICSRRKFPALINLHQIIVLDDLESIRPIHIKTVDLLLDDEGNELKPPRRSVREEIQSKIYDYLVNNEDYFNAPYGIISGMKQWGRGKARTITFGVSRYLDAEITIYREDNIQIRGEGPLAPYFEGDYESADEAIKILSKERFKQNEKYESD